MTEQFCVLFVDTHGYGAPYQQMKASGSFTHCLVEARKSPLPWIISTDFDGQNVVVACSVGQSLNDVHPFPMVRYRRGVPNLHQWRDYVSPVFENVNGRAWIVPQKKDMP